MGRVWMGGVGTQKSKLFQDASEMSVRIAKAPKIWIAQDSRKKKRMG
jgi:hypothetical protein